MWIGCKQQGLCIMRNDDYLIRKAKPDDAEELTALAILSKAHWGYPKEWLDL